MLDALQLLFGQPDAWLGTLLQHVKLSALATVLAVAIGVPAGALLTRAPGMAFAAVSASNLGRTVPSLAVLALLYPLVGTGFAPALIALVLAGIPSVLLATYTSVNAVDADVRDAAVGMGIPARDQLLRVELPMASAGIMAGIRTCAVYVVATATLASLIGGGGLGELVMAGLTNLRYDLLVAGGCLIALLAVSTDLALLGVQRRVVPLGLRVGGGSTTSGGGYRAGDALDARRWQALLLAAVGVAVAVVVVSGGMRSFISGVGVYRPPVDPDLPAVVVGSKDFTEQFVLGELYAQALEAEGFPVERRLNLGATAVADGALTRGDIDLYPEYTGTALVAVLKQQIPAADGGGGAGGARATGDPEALAAQRAGQVYGMVREGYAKRGLELLAQTPFSNGNALVVTRAVAERHHLRTLSDLAAASGSMRLGSIPGFATRSDGLPLLEDVYDMHFGQVRSYENGLKYKALLDGKVDVVYGFETDGPIARSDLVVLADDRQAWPPYHAAPVVQRSALEGAAGTRLRTSIDQVTALLDAPAMRRLNDEVEHDKRDPADVAHDFLVRQHVIEEV